MTGRVRTLAVAGCIVVAACAKEPESISPAYISPIQYRVLACDQLAEEAGRVHAALAQVSQQQRDARNGDIAGVILLGLPVSSLSGGNVASQVAQLKGERDTIDRVAIEKRCEMPVLPEIKINTGIEPAKT